MSDFLDSDDIELRTVGLPEGLHFHFGSTVPNWPWKQIAHHDLSVLGQRSCDTCFGLGYTIDENRSAERRVVRPCPNCCGQYLVRTDDDSDQNPWPRADDENFERYTALRQRVGARKTKRGRKPNEIQVTTTFVEVSPAEAAARQAQLQKILSQIDQCQQDAERVKEEVKTKPRPRMQVDAAALVADFLQVAASAGVSLNEKDIELETLLVPHQRPKRLPPGKQAAYVFCTAWDCLKIGKVGTNSEARYTSQYYSYRGAESTLSRSLLRCDPVLRTKLLAGVLPEPTEDNIGTWIERHTTRYNFLISAEQPSHVLNLLEAFLQCRLNPVFEQKPREE